MTSARVPRPDLAAIEARLADRGIASFAAESLLLAYVVQLEADRARDVASLRAALFGSRWTTVDTVIDDMAGREVTP